MLVCGRRPHQAVPALDDVLETMWQDRRPFRRADGGGIKQMEATLGFRLQEDLLHTLGDCVCIYNSPGEGGLMFTGLTVVVPLKNHDRLAKTNEQLVQVLNKAMASQPRNMFGGGPTISHTIFRKQKILCLIHSGEGMPFVLVLVRRRQAIDLVAVAAKHSRLSFAQRRGRIVGRFADRGREDSNPAARCCSRIRTPPAR